MEREVCHILESVFLKDNNITTTFKSAKIYVFMMYLTCTKYYRLVASDISFSISSMLLAVIDLSNITFSF